MKFTTHDIQNDAKFKIYVKNRQLSESTESLYARRLTDFCNYTKKSLSKLIDGILEDDVQKIRTEKLSDQVENYLYELKNEGKSVNTIRNRFDTLNAFFNEFGVSKSVITDVDLLESDDLDCDELPDKDHIKKAVQISGIRDKAIVLLHFSSGVGAIELRYLTYEDFIRSVDGYLDADDEEKLNIPQIVFKLQKIDDISGVWRIKMVKTGVTYTTFNSPESTRAILDYLMERERTNKPIKTMKDHLFVNTRNRPLEKSVHGAIFKRINEKAGFKHLNGKRRLLTAGTLRNLFEKNLYKAELEKDIINSLLGYKLKDKDEINLTDEKSLKEQYDKALSNLTLENRFLDQNFEYKKLLAKFKKNDGELKEIIEHVKSLEEMLKSLSQTKK